MADALGIEQCLPSVGHDIAMLLHPSRDTRATRELRVCRLEVRLQSFLVFPVKKLINFLLIECWDIQGRKTVFGSDEVPMEQPFIDGLLFIGSDDDAINLIGLFFLHE